MPEIHHQYAVAQQPDDIEIVADKQIGEVEPRPGAIV
jgi:hypothetical protein